MLEFHTNGKVKFNIIWAAKKVKSLLEIEDNVSCDWRYISCVNC